MNFIARDYQHPMRLTMLMKGAPKLLRLIRTSQDQGQRGSTPQFMILVAMIFNTQQCHPPYRARSLAGCRCPGFRALTIMTMNGASTETNAGSPQPITRPAFLTQSDPTGKRPPPRVFVGIASSGRTPTTLATWRIHNHFGPS